MTEKTKISKPDGYQPSAQVDCSTAKRLMKHAWIICGIIWLITMALNLIPPINISAAYNAFGASFLCWILWINERRR